MNKIKVKKRKKHITPSDLILDSIIYLALIVLAVVTVYPMWHVIVASFSSGTDLAVNRGIMLWPKSISLGGYQLVFDNHLILNGFKNSVFVLLLSLPINIVLTMLCGYFLAAKNVMYKKPITAMIMFTMYFSGGLIPSFLNIKSLGLYDTIFALVLPGALNVYNAIICKTAIEAIPESLSESAYLDGANDLQIIFRIIMPLIKPTLAVLILYYGVAHWNSWFPASIYIRNEKLLPAQNIIRAILLENSSMGNETNGDVYNAYAETIRYASIVVTTVPILCIYPMLQKHFTKGVMIGAVKG